MGNVIIDNYGNAKCYWILWSVLLIAKGKKIGIALKDLENFLSSSVWKKDLAQFPYQSAQKKTLWLFSLFSIDLRMVFTTPQSVKVILGRISLIWMPYFYQKWHQNPNSIYLKVDSFTQLGSFISVGYDSNYVCMIIIGSPRRSVQTTWKCIL